MTPTQIALWDLLKETTLAAQGGTVIKRGGFKYFLPKEKEEEFIAKLSEMDSVMDRATALGWTPFGPKTLNGYLFSYEGGRYYTGDEVIDAPLL